MTTMSLETGQCIDRYTVDKLLGRGGMAVVYRVRHNQLGSFHALKVLTVASPGIRERLLQEGRVQASLRHPHVVSVTDVIDVAGNPGLVMEYVDGPSMDHWLVDHRPDLSEAERLFRGIVAGVAAAHEKGLVHRDLKPANVLLAPASGGPSLPKVADFGLAKALFAEESVAHATRSGVTMGTPAYMAPEQIRDSKSVDHRADVFSLGCILYELVCGRPPFLGPDILSIFNAVASGSFPPPVSLVPDLPARLQNAIQGALTVDRDRRLQDCGALLAVLDGKEPSLSLISGSTLTPEASEHPEETFDPAVLGDDRVLREAFGDLSTASPGEPGIDASLSPASDAGRRPRRPRWLLVAGAVVGVGSVLGLGGGVVALAGLGAASWERQVRQAVAERTGGELTWAGASFRPGAVILQDVVLLGADGDPLATASRVRVGGRWRVSGGMHLQPRALGVDGLRLYPRIDGDGWVRPEATLAALRDRAGDSGLGLQRIATGPVVIEARGSTGALDGFVAGIVLDGVTLASPEGGWLQASDLSVGPSSFKAGDPVFSLGAVEVDDGVLQVADAEVWIRLREDGLLDLPPVLADRLPDWLGGDDHRVHESEWFGFGTSALPVPVERVEIAGGEVHVFDRAHAPSTQRWELTVDRASLGPAASPWLPVDLAGRLDAAPVAFEGDLREDGLIRGRASLRHLPLATYAPYMDRSLRHFRVEPAGGTLSATLDFTWKQDSVAVKLQGEAEQVAFVPIPQPANAPRPPASATRLAPTREQVGFGAEDAGSLADPAFRPVDAMLYVATDALLAPAGGSVDRDPRLLASTGRVRVRGATPAPVPAPITETPVDEAPTAPEADGDGEVMEERQGGDGERARRVFDRFRREVEEALEEYKVPGEQGNGGGQGGRGNRP